MTIRKQTVDGMDTQKELLLSQESKIKKYRRLFIGTESYSDLVKYELVALFASWVPGAAGLWLRSKAYPTILRECGRNVIFGDNVVLRHPSKISIEGNVVIDDNCVLDAKGYYNRGITIAKNVFIGRNSIVYCQNGNIHIGENVNIGSNCQIFSANSVVIGKNVLIGAYSYLIGGGHNIDKLDTPVIEQGRSAQGIELAENIWVGAGVKVLDGVTIGEGAIIGTGSVVKDNVPEYSIVGGVPAKVIKFRKGFKAGES